MGQGSAHAYVVESRRGDPGPDRIGAIMREAGLVHVDWFGLSRGVVIVHVGSVPEADG